MTSENTPMQYNGIVVVIIIVSLILTKSPRVILSGLIGMGCASLCYKWAVRIKSSPGLAYVLGFIFGLFGLLGYYIYYRSH
ncbi:MAG: hypothetical protein U9R08_00450 [Nanoarchaeota archaeon]|nr:hypothetical protein [Nanoarchaeota archaeon]